jgi:methyl-accepting chemotaxis protein
VDRVSPGDIKVEHLRAELTAARAEVSAYRAAMRQVVAVCQEAARGNLEPRLLHLPADPELRRVMQGINRLLDLTDAIVREAGAALSSAGQGKFYRRALPHGLVGGFQQAARLINAASGQMAAKSGSLRQAEEQRLALADEFEAAVKGVVEGVAAAATEMHTTVKGLVATANQTTHQSAAVSQASEQVSHSVATIASASEGVTATFRKIDRQVQEANQIAQRAGQETGRAQATIAELSRASQQIGQVVKLITQVASQTRLIRSPCHFRTSGSARACLLGASPL